MMKSPKKPTFLKTATRMAVAFCLLLISCSAEVQINRSSDNVRLATERIYDDSLIDTVKQVEERLNARVGLAVYDRQTNRTWQYRADERFPMSSTFKTLACASLLSRVDSDQVQLQRVVAFDKNDLVTYSPIAEKHTGGGMSLAELCHAAMSMSDNSAANFVLEAIGGPEKLTQFLRSIGDNITRIDRRETDLNEAVPGDERDTTTPNAMAIMIEKLILGNELSAESQKQLQDWMIGNKVGDDLFRSGIPSNWKIGDRTGAGGYGSRSITAVMWPPNRSPVVATLYIK